MKLKRMIPVLLFAMCISLVSPVIASNNTPVPTETPKEVLKNKIETRLLEINKMDKSDLTTAEKKDLRKEVKDLKKQARSQGVYLSVGAILLIILLLVLIL
ncbi:MAG: hypothetical protein ABI204_05915 [Ginsengibacter sp.]